MQRETIMNVIKFLLEKLSDLRVDGDERLPDSGGYIVATNHISRLDTPFLMLSTARKDVIGMIAKEYQRIPFFRWVLSSMEVIWVSREEYDFAAFRSAVDYLKHGWVVGMAPEGTRSKDGTLITGKPGVALLAKKAGVQIVPAAITGSADMAKRLSHFKKMNVHVRFGKAFSLPVSKEGEGRDYLVQATDEIMCQIGALLPEARRGVYANHPRLKVLLAHQNET
ncbi:MAG: lysophospholipid acyltransferase family protein [Anaerolineaceae bacterium]